ncbi:MAG: hypothetical protein DWQ02_01620 [Bacteroidetes bacterium]|nr:MAG: hypothetical protein DWQ02_01620 [Bacteroidota bacterium]
MSNKYLALIQSKVNHQFDELKIRVKQTTSLIKARVNAYWFKAALLGVAIWMFYVKDVSINLNLKAKASNLMAVQSSEQITNKDDLEAKPQNTSLVGKKSDEKSRTKSKKQEDDNLMNTYSNLPFDGNSLELSDSERRKLEKIQKQKAYVKKYAALAKKEMKDYGIPASITLAQGLLESNAGESKLAKNNRNHFGMKCFSRKCKKGHCSNFTDDSHKDFFKIFETPADSYRAHSKLLRNGSRYNGLFKLKKSDYKGWSRGLRKAGYATDPNYDKKLIRLIEELKLYRYD